MQQEIKNERNSARVSEAAPDAEQFEIVQEKTGYQRYLHLRQTIVKFPDGRQVDFDIVGHDRINPTFCVIFPFFTDTQETTLIKEYAQGVNRLVYTLAAGAFEPDKHTSLLDSAKHELEEEMRLTGGTWISLLDFLDTNEDPQLEIIKTTGISELKWGTNTFAPFLVLDPHRISAQDALPRDAEEYILLQKKINVAELKKLIMTGQLMLPAVQTIWMGLERLKQMKIIKDF